MYILLLFLSFLLPQNPPEPQTIDEILSIVDVMLESNCDSALVLLEGLKDTAKIQPEIAGHIDMKRGMATYCLRRYEDALSHYYRAVDHFEQSSQIAPQIETINLIGTLHKKGNSFKIAQKYYEQGLEIARKHQDTIGIGNSLNNIGLIHFQQNDTKKALSYFLESTKYKEMARDTLGLGYNYDNLGQTYAQLGSLDSALIWFHKSLVFREAINGHITYAIVENNIGETLLMFNHYQQAEPYFLRALKTAKEVGYADFESHILMKLSELHEQLGNSNKALSLYKNHVVIKDSLLNVRKEEAVLELATKYETEKKEQQLALQSAQIAEQHTELQRNLIFIAGLISIIILLLVIFALVRSRLRRQNEMLLKENTIKLREAQIEATIASEEKERKRFAKDLHDGFGQMISVLNLNLQSLKEGKSKSHEVFDRSSRLLEEMYGELRRICFNLMPQTLILKGLTAAFQELALKINQSNQIHLSVQVHDLEGRLTEIQEVSIYRIVQEWINNILKYSDATAIHLQLTKDTEELTAVIEDNGMGFNIDKLKNGSGNGWKNILSRSNLIRGEAEIDTREGLHGSTFILNAAMSPQYVQKVEKIPA